MLEHLKMKILKLKFQKIRISNLLIRLREVTAYIVAKYQSCASEVNQIPSYNVNSQTGEVKEDYIV
jgi:hypothetical protein